MPMPSGWRRGPRRWWPISTRSGEAEEQGIAAPQEEVEAWLADRGWHLAALEPGAGAAARAALEAGARGWPRGRRGRWRGDWLAQADAGRRRRCRWRGFGPRWPRRGRTRCGWRTRFGVDVIAVFRRLALVPGARWGW